MDTVVKPKEANVKRISSCQPKDIRFLSLGEINIFIHETTLTWSNGESKYKLGVGLIFIMYTSLRAGETLALKWKSFIPGKWYLLVKEAASYGKERDDSMHLTGKLKKYNDAPKTKAGIRDVHPLEQVIEYINIPKEMQNPKLVEEYVFATSQGAAAVGYYSSRRTFNLVCKNCGIQNVDESMGLRVLRHILVSLLCREGIGKPIIAKIVGQPDIAMIERVHYHIMREEKDSAIMKLETEDVVADTASEIVVASQLGGFDIDNLAF